MYRMAVENRASFVSSDPKGKYTLSACNIQFLEPLIGSAGGTDLGLLLLMVQNMAGQTSNGFLPLVLQTDLTISIQNRHAALALAALIDLQLLGSINPFLDWPNMQGLDKT